MPLFVVATPIGNLEAMSPRATRILAEAEIIACEDTRVTGKLMESLGIRAPLRRLDAHASSDAVEALAERISTVPVNQLMMQKMVINQAIEAMGMRQTQQLATVFDGITRHSPEGIHFKRRAEQVGWKQAVRERDDGSFDWTANKPFDD